MTTDADEFEMGWTEHRREQVRAIARRTTPAQRVAWLEEALEIARQSGALASARAARARFYERLQGEANPS